jgi:hypothetical protein
VDDGRLLGDGLVILDRVSYEVYRRLWAKFSCSQSFFLVNQCRYEVTVDWLLQIDYRFAA